MNNEIQNLIKEICSNVVVKECLGSKHNIEETCVKVEIQFEDDGFYTSISGELNGRELRGLGISGSGETLVEALYALKEEIESL